MFNKARIILMSVIVSAVIFVCGCQHYEVRDTQTGQMYYTTAIHHKQGGAITFKDEKSNRKVLLQSHDVKKIDRTYYDAQVYPR